MPDQTKLDRYGPVIGDLQAILEAGDRPAEDLPRVLMDQLQRHAERGNRAAELDALIAELSELADLAKMAPLTLATVCERLLARVAERSDLLGLNEPAGSGIPDAATHSFGMPGLATDEGSGAGPDRRHDDGLTPPTPGELDRIEALGYDRETFRFRDGTFDATSADLLRRTIAGRVHGDPHPEAPIVVAVRPGTGMLARRMSDGRWYVLDVIPGDEPLHDAEVGELQEYEVCRDGVSAQ